MGHYDTSMIGIVTSGVFSARKDMDALKARITEVLRQMRAAGHYVDIGEDPSHCMSAELSAHKGDMVVLGGVFNYWEWKGISELAGRLQDALGTDVLAMTWCEDGPVNCAVFSPEHENPLEAIFRRVGG